MNVLYHQGLPALLSYLGALCFSFVRWIKDSGEEATTAMIGAGLLAYGIQAFFGFSMCSTAGLFWILWGLFEGKKRGLPGTQQNDRQRMDGYLDCRVHG